MADVIAREWAYLGGCSSVRKRTLTQRPICNQHSLAHTGTLFTTAHTRTHFQFSPFPSLALSYSCCYAIFLASAIQLKFSRSPAWSLSHIHLGDHIWPSHHRLHTKRAQGSLPSPQTNQRLIMPELLAHHQHWASKNFIRVYMHCACGPVLSAYLSDGARLENLQSQLTQRFSKQQTLLLLKNYRWVTAFSFFWREL